MHSKRRIPTTLRIRRIPRYVINPARSGDILTVCQHHEWAGKLAHKFGNAAVYGAGATFGADLVNDVMRKF